MNDLILLLVAYLLGSIPTAYLLRYLSQKEDIRHQGSGNVGGMNAYRTGGLAVGLSSALLDIAKGMAAAYLAITYGDNSLLPYLAAFFVVLGHNWMFWLGFKGGKGLAAGAGAFVLIDSLVLSGVILVLLVLWAILKDANVAAGVAVLTLPLFLLLRSESIYVILIAFFTALVIAIKHRQDFQNYSFR